MSQLRVSTLPAFALLALLAIQPTRLQAQGATANSPSAPDANLYTNYYGTATSVNWIVCGSTEESEGCYDFGTIGPFVAVGAMLESNPKVAGDVVTRFIYVVDAGASPVTMDVYKKTDTVSSSFDTTVVTFLKTVSLKQLVGGSDVTTYMAANPKYLFIGTSLSPNAVSVAKGNLKVAELGGFSPPIDVTSITSDQYGFVTVTQGSAFTVYDPNGSYVEDGGGTQFMLGATQAVPASSLLIGDFTPHVRVKPKPPNTAGQE
jgi:hypothetical protein